MAKSPEEQHHAKATGWAARTQLVSSPPSNFPGGQLGIKMRPSRCCIVGSCHSDLHKIENEWGNTICSSLLGHEIVGVVTEIGSKMQKFKVGDKVGVGCMVGSCLSCDNCTNHLEKYCPKIILTCGSTYHDGNPTYGGYSDLMVADEHFVVRIPDNLALDGCPSLLCAGITTYSPLKYYGLDKSVMHLGVVGLGGLGHAAVKFAKAFALKVTVVSTSPGKKEEATQRLGADSFLTGRELSQIQAFGAPGNPLELPIFPLIAGRKIVDGSGIGGMRETKEMIDFAIKYNIMADIELIPIDYVNTTMKRLAKADVRYQFAVEIADSLKPI